jgi:hypothetical protein
MQWFGYRPFASICAKTYRAVTPIGCECGWCPEPIAPDDNGFLLPNRISGELQPWHYECYLRLVLGGVFHQAGKCGCHGGTSPPDPPDMTKREAARAAVAFWHDVRGSGG